LDDIAQSKERMFMLRKIVINTTFAIMTMAWLLNSISINNTTVHATVQHAGQSTTNNISSDIRVFVDGQQVHFEDQPPIIVDGRTLVPVRGVFEHMGFTVEWIDVTRTAMLEGPGHSITIPVDELTFIVQRSADFGVPHTITPDVPQQIVNGRTMLPLRAVSEAIGVSVEWDGENRMVLIDTNVGNDGNGIAVSITSVAISEPTPEPSVVEANTSNFVDGFVDINGIRPIEMTRNEWVSVLESTRSSIALPNRRLAETERQAWIDEYNALGGMNEFELQIVRLTNEFRVSEGLPQLEICTDAMMAARFYAQTMADLNTGLGHDRGPYGNSTTVISVFTGGTGSGANGAVGIVTPEEHVERWINSPGHRQNLLTNFPYVGVGATAPYVYLMFNW